MKVNARTIDETTGLLEAVMPVLDVTQGSALSAAKPLNVAGADEIVMALLHVLSAGTAPETTTVCPNTKLCADELASLHVYGAENVVAAVIARAIGFTLLTTEPPETRHAVLYGPRIWNDVDVAARIVYAPLHAVAVPVRPEMVATVPTAYADADAWVIVHVASVVVTEMIAIGRVLKAVVDAGGDHVGFVPEMPALRKHGTASTPLAPPGT